jgi:hypothetical protein
MLSPTDTAPGSVVVEGVSPAEVWSLVSDVTRTPHAEMITVP